MVSTTCSSWKGSGTWSRRHSTCDPPAAPSRLLYDSAWMLCEEIKACDWLGLLSRVRATAPVATRWSSIALSRRNRPTRRASRDACGAAGLEIEVVSAGVQGDVAARAARRGGPLRPATRFTATSRCGLGSPRAQHGTLREGRLAGRGAVGTGARDLIEENAGDARRALALGRLGDRESRRLKTVACARGGSQVIAGGVETRAAKVALASALSSYPLGGPTARERAGVPPLLGRPNLWALVDHLRLVQRASHSRFRVHNLRRQ